MTFRAIILGLLGAVLLAAGGHYAVDYLPIPNPVRGHLPISVFGLLIVFVVAVNPIIAMLRTKWRLKPGEIAIAVALTLVGCSITDAGLLRFFPSTAIYPIHMNNEEKPGWRDTGVLAKTPPMLLANRGQYSDEVVGNYVRAMGKPGQPISITQVPWHAWWQTLGIWSAIILSVALAVICLSVIVHGQWAKRERIRYPLAEVAGSLLERDDAGRTKIIRNRLFWLGMGIPLTVHLINGIKLWFPSSIEIPLVINCSALETAFPEFMKTPGARYFAWPRIYPACVGLTFLLATDIGFSLGIANPLGVTIMYYLLVVGVDMGGGYLSGSYPGWQNFGSYLGIAAVLLYTGRRHYLVSLKQAVTFGAPGRTSAAGWACRGLIVFSVAGVLLLRWAGLDWPLAILALALTMLMFFIVGRLNAECGTFFYKPTWGVCGVIVGLFGFTALGPKMVIILGLFLFLTTGDPFECLMPFALNGLKISTDTGNKPGRVGISLACAFVLAFAVAVPLALWADYNNVATATGGRWAAAVYDTAANCALQLELSRQPDDVDAYTSWDRLRNMQIDRSFAAAVVVGFALVVACGAMRLRCSWWPLHPVVFLGFGAWTMGKYGASFFLGWLIKAGVMRFGGGRGYRSARKIMIGVIVGDLTGGFLMTAVAWIYYAITDVAPPGYHFW